MRAGKCLLHSMNLDLAVPFVLCGSDKIYHVTMVNIPEYELYVSPRLTCRQGLAQPLHLPESRAGEGWEWQTSLDKAAAICTTVNQGWLRQKARGRRCSC